MSWVRVSRSVFDHPVFAPEPFTEREAWLWLIANAAWKETQHRVGNAICEVPRGALFVTLRELQLVWRWQSDKRVRGFLDRLENGRMVGRKTDAGKTLISICNYEKYQDAGRSEDAGRTQSGRKADALKEQGNKIEDISAAASGAGEAIEIADKCIQALGPAANPTSIGLQTACPAVRWIADGADLEADILPVMRRYGATKPPGSIRSWQSWMAQDVADHRARRLQPLPQGRATGPPQRRSGGGMEALDEYIKLERQADEALGSGQAPFPRLAIAG